MALILYLHVSVDSRQEVRLPKFKHWVLVFNRQALLATGLGEAVKIELTDKGLVLVGFEDYREDLLLQSVFVFNLDGVVASVPADDISVMSVAEKRK